MSSGERPIGAAKGTQSDTEALCQPPPPPLSDVLERPYTAGGGGGCLRLTAIILLRCLRCQEDLRFKNIVGPLRRGPQGGPPSAGTTGAKFAPPLPRPRNTVPSHPPPNKAERLVMLPPPPGPRVPFPCFVVVSPPSPQSWGSALQVWAWEGHRPRPLCGPAAQTMSSSSPSPHPYKPPKSPPPGPQKPPTPPHTHAGQGDALPQTAHETSDSPLLR